MSQFSDKDIDTVIGYYLDYFSGLKQDAILRRCLQCNKVFIAKGKYNRQCHTCNKAVSDRRPGEGG